MYASHEEAAAAQAEMQRTSPHALMMFRPMCEVAAKFERERNGGFGRGVTKRFNADEIACQDCAAVIRNGGSTKRNLLAEIKADMVRRNPRVADPEWASEDYRPLRNRR